LFSKLPFPLPSRVIRRPIFLLVSTVLIALVACFGLSESDEHYNAGVNLIKEKKYAEALAEFDQAVLLDDSSAAAYHNQALVKEQMGRLTEALDDYTRAIALDSALFMAYTNRGGLYNKLGKLEEARVDFQRAIRLDGESASAHTQMSLTLINLGQMSGDLEILDRAISIDPEFSQA